MSGGARRFGDLRRLLTDAGYAVADSSYSPESSGSWWILLRGETSYRLVWVGKDQWPILQRQAAPSDLGESNWEDLGVEKDIRQATPEDLLQLIRETVGGDSFSGQTPSVSIDAMSLRRPGAANPAVFFGAKAPRTRAPMMKARRAPAWCASSRSPERD